MNANSPSKSTDAVRLNFSQPQLHHRGSPKTRNVHDFRILYVTIEFQGQVEFNNCTIFPLFFFFKHIPLPAAV